MNAAWSDVIKRESGCQMFIWNRSAHFISTLTLALAPVAFSVGPKSYQTRAQERSNTVAEWCLTGSVQQLKQSRTKDTLKRYVRYLALVFPPGGERNTVQTNAVKYCYGPATDHITG